MLIEDNYSAGGSPVLSVSGWQTVRMELKHAFRLAEPVSLSHSTAAPPVYQIDHNTYLGGEASTLFYYQNQKMDYAQWQQAGEFDDNIRRPPTASGRPAGTNVFIRPNQYESPRANVVVYNWDLKSSVDVDLHAVIRSGERFEIRNVLNYYADPAVSGDVPRGSSPIADDRQFHGAGVQCPWVCTRGPSHSPHR